MPSFLFRAIALATALAALAIVGIYFFERPTTLRVAVPRGSDAQKLMIALNQEALRGRENIRFRVVAANDARASAKLMEDKAVDLAVVRSDIAMPTNAATALILEHQYMLVAAPPGTPYSSIADLRDKRIAVVASEMSGGDNLSLLDLLEAQYSLPPQSILRKPTDQANLANLIDSGAVDAVLAFGRFDSPQLVEVVRALSHAANGATSDSKAATDDGKAATGGGIAATDDGKAATGDGKAVTAAPTFIPILEAAAIAKKNPGIESTNILRGAFGGAPARPGEDVETIGASVRLVASDDLANSTVGDVVRVILAHRTAAAAVAPVANNIEAPETEKGGVLPTHPGAAAFIDGEEETFFDKYSDMIYIGAMGASLLVSGFATLASRLAVQGYERFEHLMEQALVILKSGRDAADLTALSRLELEIDEILTLALATGQMRKLDGHQLTALTLAIQQARLAIADRRAELTEKSANI